MFKSSLIIFAREPKPGEVKTRLLKHFSGVEVDRLYKAFVRDVTAQAAKVGSCRKVIYYTGTREPGAFLKQFKGFQFVRQHGATLGQRMYHAFKRESRLGARQMLIVGTDCPQLSAAEMSRAFTRLNRAEGVLGPSTDGGYYLIGLRRPVAALFSGISWSTNSVLLQTLRRAKSRGVSVARLGRKTDIDTLEALRSCGRRLTGRTAPNTAAVLSELRKKGLL